MLNDALGRTGLNNKGTQTADYRVLVQTNCPAVLVECGYLSNPTEAAMLIDSKFQQQIATALADGICSAVRKAK